MAGLRTTTAITLILLVYRVLGHYSLLPRDGPVSGLVGYSGMVYQATRYEPLCGNLGTGSFFSKPQGATDLCTPAMEAFDNNTADALAIYDLTGARLEEGVVGNGYDSCLCFALSQLGATTLQGGLCVWVSGDGETYMYSATGGTIASSYRPNIKKSLPFCKDIDLPSAKAAWSATAAQGDGSDVVNTISGGGRIVTDVVTTTFIPSVVNYTLTTTLTTTGPDGVPTTQTLTRTTELPVVTVTADPEGGLTGSDKIALGVGLGIGIPTLVLMVVGVWLNIKQRKFKRDLHKAVPITERRALYGI